MFDYVLVTSYSQDVRNLDIDNWCNGGTCVIIVSNITSVWQFRCTCSKLSSTKYVWQFEKISNLGTCVICITRVWLFWYACPAVSGVAAGSKLSNRFSPHTSLPSLPAALCLTLPSESVISDSGAVAWSWSCPPMCPPVSGDHRPGLVTVRPISVIAESLTSLYLSYQLIGDTQTLNIDIVCMEITVKPVLCTCYGHSWILLVVSSDIAVRGWLLHKHTPRYYTYFHLHIIHLFVMPFYQPSVYVYFLSFYVF